MLCRCACSILQPAAPTVAGPSPHPQVMHAYIDGKRFSGLSLDEALRQLLQGFRCGLGGLTAFTASALPWPVAGSPLPTLAHRHTYPKQAAGRGAED